MTDDKKIINLYKKYGTINQVRMRTGKDYRTIRKILKENGVEIKQTPKPHYDYTKVSLYYRAARYRRGV